MAQTNFEYLLEKGKATERIIQDLLIAEGFKIQDVSDDKEYQDIDVDMLMTISNGKEYRLEIKSDSKISKNGNFFLEKGFDRYSGYYKGWLHKCEADILCMYDSVNKIAYMLAWQDTKQYAIANGKQITWWNYSDNCRGYAILLGIEEAKNNDLILKVYNLNGKELDEIF